MSKFDCPHCKQPAFSIWDKYLAAKWKILTCPHCETRVCSTPLLLAMFYMLYLADVIDFGYLLFTFGDMIWGVVAVVVWLLLDILSIYLPLTAMRPKSSVKAESELLGQKQ